MATTEFDESDEARSTSYGRVLGGAELAEVKLISLQYSLTPEAGADGAARSFKGSIENVDFHSDRGVAFVFNRWRVEEKVGGKESFVVDAMFVAIYSGLSDADSDAVGLFLQSLVPFSVYPYFRSLVSQLAWMGGTTMPAMPILRTPKSEDAEQQSNAEEPPKRRVATPRRKQRAAKS